MEENKEIEKSIVNTEELEENNTPELYTNKQLAHITTQIIEQNKVQNEKDYKLKKYIFVAVATIAISFSILAFISFKLYINLDFNAINNKTIINNIEYPKTPNENISASNTTVNVGDKKNVYYYKSSYNEYIYFNSSTQVIACKKYKNYADYGFILQPKEKRSIKFGLEECKDSNLIEISSEAEFKKLYAKVLTIGPGQPVVEVIPTKK